MYFDISTAFLVDLYPSSADNEEYALFSGTSHSLRVIIWTAKTIINSNTVYPSARSLT